MSENCPEFFKVYMPIRSAQRLLIPPAFVMKFNKIMPKKAILRDLTGKLWHVELKKVEKNWFIQNGWHDFVLDNSLEYGNFIIFTYSQNSVFNVRLFDKDGCRKNNDLAIVQKATHVKKERDSEAVQNDCRFPHACKRKSSKALGTKNIGESPGIRQCKSRITASNVEKHKVFNAEEFVMPNYPHFVAFINRCNRYSVQIPSSALKQYKINFKPAIVLCDQSGKLWPMKVTIRADGRFAFTAGWFHFWKHMKLKLKDKCLFEFILEEGNLCEQVRVQVSHARPRIKKKL